MNKSIIFILVLLGYYIIGMLSALYYDWIVGDDHYPKVGRYWASGFFAFLIIPLNILITFYLIYDKIFKNEH